MNEIIKQQLEKIQIANMSNFNADTNTYHIPKYSEPKYDIGKCYLVKLDKNIINNTNSVLAINWNAGKAPTAEYYKIYVNSTAGKMIKIDGLEFDFINKTDKSTMFSGWLNIEDLTQLEVL